MLYVVVLVFECKIESVTTLRVTSLTCSLDGREECESTGCSGLPPWLVQTQQGPLGAETEQLCFCTSGEMGRRNGAASSN